MKNLILVMTLLFTASATTMAQKIAYADVNAILGVMPENEKINADLEIYATGLQKKLGDMQAQLDGMVKEFQRVLATGDTTKALELQKQAMEGDKQVRQANAQAEQQLATKRNEFLQPVLDRIRGAMAAVAKKKGFDYVMNSHDGSGTSIILWGPDHNITRDVVDELGIELKQPDGAAQPAPGDGKKGR